ncbi:MAG: CoA-binding protein [Deltaproteobacteria bacterium]|jgi:predicted CoA-binding protein|nr:CoA-binding protein [Solirubrobacterales bacterium]MBA3821095.1 CoA-binding protein [Deltaproteobacteria bacterium]
MEPDVEKVLTSYRTWAIVGCSPNPDRDSNQIAAVLQKEGYTVIPVNPSAEEILGERCYPSLQAIPEDAGVEVVDVFRRSEDAGVHVDEAIEMGARAVWLQRGVIDEAAAERARAAGLDVVMDRSPRTELKRMRAEQE